LSIRIFQVPKFSNRNEKLSTYIIYPKSLGSIRIPKLLNSCENLGKHFSGILESAQMYWATWKNSPMFLQVAQFFLGSLENPSPCMVQHRVKLTASYYFIYPLL